MSKLNEDGLQYGDLLIPKDYLPKAHEGISTQAQEHWQRENAEQLFYLEVRKSMLQNGYPNHIQKPLAVVNHCFVCESSLEDNGFEKICKICGTRYVKAVNASKDDYNSAFVVERI